MKRSLTALIALALAPLLAPPALAAGEEGSPAAKSAMSPRQLREQISFGADMAQKGNWREAMFRWKRVLEQEPNNPKLHNNLAVAYETLGDYSRAEEEYKIAMKGGPDLKEVRQNYTLFRNFYDRYSKTGTREETAPPPPQPPPAPAASGPPGGGRISRLHRLAPDHRPSNAPRKANDG
ncbi:MAG: hypothetical protein DMF49_06905 [Acidobacteria bacterium]|nr:MAG: hypothetical protein DMF49_06905 [Acidobacteriota bacterium]